MITVKSLLTDHLEYTFEKEAWHPPLARAVQGLTAAQAAWKPSAERHSIWQIVRHLIHWKRGVLQSWDGDPPDYDTMSRGDWEEVAGDQAAWEADVQVLHETSAEFGRRLEALDEEGVQGSVRAYQQSHQPTLLARRLLWMLTHDAYHAGQIQYLRALQGIPADRFYNAASQGEVARLREVLEAHHDLLNAHGPDGWTALQLAAYYGHPDVVGILLEWGADVHVKSTNEMANTALHGAVAARRTQIASLLLDHGADPDATDAGGNTALHLAAHEGVPEIVTLLLQHGASVNSRRHDSKTPLGVALAEGKSEVVGLLRMAGGAE